MQTTRVFKALLSSLVRGGEGESVMMLSLNFWGWGRVGTFIKVRENE